MTSTKQMALYRKYRPSGFDGLIGQDHIKTTLENAIKNNSVSHAYIFTGPRGTGKTSTAKLFAKALNCENPNGVNPCGNCHSCTNDASDIIEIDAASNNSVDDIRQLRENIMLAPMYGKYKIYILDEVHMLTSQAFNAFLKTLEEPPAHARFILATTEVHKLPATILSRCQRFDFRRISNQDIVGRLSYILSQEGRTAENQAVELIAQVSAGGMRDAISLLDQSLSRKENPSLTVTLDDVLALTGSVDVRVIGKLISLISNKKIEEALTHFNQCFENGKEPKFFVEEMMIYLRDILVFKKLGPSAALKKGSTDENFQNIAQAVVVDDVYNYLNELQRTLSEMKFHHDLQLLLEMTIIRMINNDSSLQAQIDQLRLMITAGVPVVQAKNESVVSQEPQLINSLPPIQAVVENTVEPLMLNNSVTEGTIATEQSNEDVPTSSGQVIVVPELMNTDEGTQTAGSLPNFELPNFTREPVVSISEQPLSSEPNFMPEFNAASESTTSSDVITVDDPIGFIEQSIQQHTEGIDWKEAMPSENQPPTGTEELNVDVVVEETKNNVPNVEFEQSPPNAEPVFNLDFSFEQPAQNEAIGQSPPNAEPMFNLNFSFEQPAQNVASEQSPPPIEEPMYHAEVSVEQTSTVEPVNNMVSSESTPVDNGQPLNNGNVILSNVEKDVLNHLQTATTTHREGLEQVIESIKFELGNVNISTKRIFNDFIIKAVNDTHFILVHSNKVQVALINKLAHKKNIKEVFENLYKPMEYVAITEAEWNTVVKAYK